MERPVPGFFRIARVDYPASLTVIFFVVGWGIYAAAAAGLLGRVSDGPQAETSFFLWFAAAATVVGLPVLLWRVNLIRRAFGSGTETTGVVTGVWFYRGRGRVNFSYEADGQSFSSGNAVQKSPRAAALAKGQQVTLALDPDRPGRAFIRDLFLD